MPRRPLGVLALGLILATAAAPRAQEAPPASDAQPPVVRPAGAEPQPEPSPVRWEGTTAILGNVRLDSATKTVSATGWVNQTEGAVEVLACGLEGKVHEAVFVLPLNPLDLQAALLLAGLKSGEPMPALGEGPPRGDPVDVFVDWQAADEARSARAESFLWDVVANAPLPETPWCFTGSVVKNGRFQAFAEDTYVASYWDPFAIVNLPLPCAGNDEALHAHSNSVPPYHTPVTFRFVPRPPAADAP